jgi:hypothetical protein
MKPWCGMVLVVALAAFAGCGSTVSDNPVAVETQPPPAKKMLESVAQSGELGSGAMEIRDALQKMKEAGDPKADELLADLDQLQTMSDPNAVKKKAAEMAAKL